MSGGGKLGIGHKGFWQEVREPFEEREAGCMSELKFKIIKELGLHWIALP